LTLPNNSSSPNSVVLLPGTYDLSSLSANFSSFVPATSTPSPGFNITSPPKSTVAFADDLVLYSSPFYQGSSVLVSPSQGTNSTGSSFLLGDGLFAVLIGNGGQRAVAWTGLPDTSSLGQVTVQTVQGTGCAGGCSSGGTCGLDGTCVCASGFTGTRCGTLTFCFPVSKNWS
jgi:hypothetical protein